MHSLSYTIAALHYSKAPLLSIIMSIVSLPSSPPAGMNAAVRAVVRMGLYVGAKVYFIHEVSPSASQVQQKHDSAQNAVVWN